MSGVNMVNRITLPTVGHKSYLDEEMVDGWTVDMDERGSMKNRLVDENFQVCLYEVTGPADWALEGL